MRHDVPILFISGHASRSLHERARAMQRVAHLRKPFRQEGLARALQDLLGSEG